MKRIMTPEEFIIRHINAYPSLYAAPTYDKSKFRILDNCLNTLGNGLGIKDFHGKTVKKAEIQSAQQWFNCGQAAYGYTLKTDHDHKLFVPVDQTSNYPDIERWIKIDCNLEIYPYPMFKKEYSLVWDNESFSELGAKWVDAARWFYVECFKFFMDEEAVKRYYYAFPKRTDKETQTVIDDYKRLIGRYYPTNDDVSKAYGCESLGDRNNNTDVSAFIRRRWDQERLRILDFIKETIFHLAISF